MEVLCLLTSEPEKELKAFAKVNKLSIFVIYLEDVTFSRSCMRESLF